MLNESLRQDLSNIIHAHELAETSRQLPKLYFETFKRFLDIFTLYASAPTTVTSLKHEASSCCTPIPAGRESYSLLAHDGSVFRVERHYVESRVSYNLMFKHSSEFLEHRDSDIAEDLFTLANNSYMNKIKPPKDK